LTHNELYPMAPRNSYRNIAYVIAYAPWLNRTDVAPCTRGGAAPGLCMSSRHHMSRREDIDDSYHLPARRSVRSARVVPSAD